jgi:pimeloyl-ACP methyl ester carboxylesterase
VATHDRCSLAHPNDATPVILLHGLAVSHRYLMPLAARLADHRPVHVVDLPGFGLSGDPGRVLDVASTPTTWPPGSKQPGCQPWRC